MLCIVFYFDSIIFFYRILCLCECNICLTSYTEAEWKRICQASNVSRVSQVFLWCNHSTSTYGNSWLSETKICLQILFESFLLEEPFTVSCSQSSYAQNINMLFALKFSVRLSCLAFLWPYICFFVVLENLVLNIYILSMQFLPTISIYCIRQQYIEYSNTITWNLKPSEML